MATLIWKDGKPYEVPDTKVNQALADGFTVPNQEQASRIVAGDQTLEAAGEGVLRGATFGLSDKMLAEGPMKKYRKEENPLAAGGGEIGGLIGSSLIGGPAAGAAKLGSGVAARLGGGVLATGAGAAVEGSLYGLGSAISESGLDDTELSAEKLAAGALAGAVVNGTVGMAFKGLSTGAKAIGEKLSQGAPASERLKSLANSALKAELATKGQLKRGGGSTEHFWDEIMDFGRKEGIITKGTTFENGFEAAVDAVERRQGQYDQILESLQAQVPAASSTNSRVAADVLEDVQKALKPFERDPFKSKAAEKLLSTITPLMEDPNVTWREMYGVTSSMRAELGDTSEVVSVARDAMKESIFKKSDKILANEGAFRQLNKEYAQATTLKDLFGDRLLSHEAKGAGVGPVIAAGAAGFMAGGPVGAIGAAGTAMLSGKIKERAGFFAAGVLHDLAQGDLLPGIAETFRKQIIGKLQLAPETLGAFAAPLRMAAAKGAMELLDTHLQLAHSNQGEAYMQAVGLKPETPQESREYEQKLANLEAIKRAGVKYDKALDAGIEGFLANGPSEKRPKLDLSKYDAAAENIQKVLAYPESVFAEAHPELAAAAPTTVNSALAVGVRAAQFLQGKLPKSPYYGLPPALAQPWEASDAEKARFMGYVKAVEGPQTILDDMRRGILTPEQQEVAQVIYPRLFEDMRVRLVSKMGELKERLPFGQRLVLSSLLGPEVLGLDQQALAIVQSVHAKSGAGNQPMKRPDGRQSVDTEKNLETQSQKLEGRNS